MEKMSSKDQENIFDLYQEMTGADVLGNITGNIQDLGQSNKDDYASKDQRIPKLLGNVQTRSGKIKKSKKSRRKIKKKSK
jgi:hypothetical protein